MTNRQQIPGGGWPRRLLKVMLVVALATVLAAYLARRFGARGDEPKPKRAASWPHADVENRDVNMTSNPLLAEYTTPFKVPPFHQIQEAHYVPAFEEAMRRHRAEIAAITDDPKPPDFANTVEALDRSGALLSRISRVFYGLLSANTTDEMAKIAEALSPKLSKHQDDILLSERLFARVEAVHRQKAALTLDAEQQTLLEELYQDFVRGGAALDASGKARLREINKELALTSLAFKQNMLKENNAFELFISREADLAGLPERVRAAAAKAAEDRGKRGQWLFTLHKPSLIPFIQFSDRRALREQLLRGYISRGGNGDARDNRANLSRIVRLRMEKAKLLGHETYAHFQLAARMASSPDKVRALLDRLWKAALPVARREAGELQALLEKDRPGEKLQPWDWWYYAEKLRKARYDLDDSELRPYFKLENTLSGAFTVAQKLYGLTFQPRDDLPVYHEDVRAYEVKDSDGSHLGLFYVDYFPRAGKRGGAWCGGYRSQIKEGGERVAPVVVNVGNFSAPAAGKPALLSFEEVETLFHEFGHALHSLLADTTYPGSRASIRVDFVELPSQVLENWATEPEVLRLYAKHHETGEVPLQPGLRDREYLAACYLDMAWHELTELPEDLDVAAFEEAALDQIGLIPEIVVRYRSSYFEHIFSGDWYAAGYYSYIWSQVLDADAFAAFKETSLFDPKTAAAFRHLLERGGAEDPMVLYKRFRGAEPGIEPLLRRKGLLRQGE